MSQISNLFLSIGKPVKDEYGRAVGRIVSFALTPNGKFDAAFIELSDGKFSKQPIENLMFNGADVTFISRIKSKASIFCDQIPFIWRKDQALKDLAEKKKISSDLYKELHTNFDSILTQLKKDAQVLSDEIAQEVMRCEEEIKALNYAILHLELEHEIGKISDETYQTAFKLLQDSLKRANTEKSDMELTKTKLSNILLGDSKELPQKTKTVAMPINEAPELPEPPEPPVVVYVKEIGKAGI
jgi:hypothetical protein